MFYNPTPVQDSIFVKLNTFYNPAPSPGRYLCQTVYFLLSCPQFWSVCISNCILSIIPPQVLESIMSNCILSEIPPPVQYSSYAKLFTFYNPVQFWTICLSNCILYIIFRTFHNPAFSPGQYLGQTVYFL